MHTRYNTVEYVWTIPYEEWLEADDAHVAPPPLRPSIRQQGRTFELLRLSLQIGGVMHTWSTVSRDPNSPNYIIRRLEELAQSETLRDLLSDGNTSIVLSQMLVTRPDPGGVGTPLPKQYADLARKRCVVLIRNPNDNLCFDRALVVLEHQDARENDRPLWKRVTDHRLAYQHEKAVELRARVPSVPAEAMVSFEDVHYYETLLQRNVLIWLLDGVETHCAYPTNFSSCRFPMDTSYHLVLHDNHYDAITNIKAFHGKRFWNSEDMTGVYSVTQCWACKQQDVDCVTVKGKEISCKDCRRAFKNAACFQRHKEKKVCEKFTRCCNCRVEYRTPSPKHRAFETMMRDGEALDEYTDADTQEVWTALDDVNYTYFNPRLKKPTTVKMARHKCGYTQCPNCKLYHDMKTHTCYIMTPRASHSTSETAANARIGYFDFETDQSSARSIHVVTHAAAEYSDGTKFWFEGDNVMKRFMEWMFKEEHAKWTFIAHNGGKYDNLFLLSELLERTWEKKADVVFATGGRLLKLTFDKVRVIDSYAHISRPLKQFPKMFGLDSGPKGDYPYLFNTEENLNYVGPYPNGEYYGLFAKKGKDFIRTAAFLLEKKLSGAVFDNKKEMRAYCEQDVTILRKGCMAYAEIVHTQTGIDPWQCLTLASCAQKFYLTQLMPEKSIEIIDLPRPGKVVSEEGKMWLAWCEHASEDSSLRLQRDKKIGYKYVDGYDPATRSIYEFDGCFFHGCVECFPNPNAINVLTGKPMIQLREETEARNALYESWGYRMVVGKSCEFKRQLKTDPACAAFKDLYNKQKPIDPRDALFGGRTDMGKTYHAIDEESSDKIRYVDFTSLYPAVMKQKVYPTGAHEVIRPAAGDVDVTPYFGLVKCTITPPTAHPRFGVVPARSANGKLCFDLTPKTGTWTTVDLQDFIREGYTVARVYEVWHYPQRTHLFSEYVDRWLKIKTEASGYPRWADTEEAKDRFIQQFAEIEDVHLDKESITSNPGLRSVAKLYLNSLWGKFCENKDDRVQQEFCSDPAEFFKVIGDDAWDWGKSMFHFFGAERQEKVLFELKCRPELRQQSRHSSMRRTSFTTNSVIGAFTTAYARAMLFDLMKTVGDDHVLYWDTDSCVYVEDASNAYLCKPKRDPRTGAIVADAATNRSGFLGDFLGELTDEFDDAATSWGVEFVATAPKSYSIRMNDGTTVTKCKGVPLSFENAARVNHELMKSLVVQQADKRLRELPFKRLLQECGEDPDTWQPSRKRQKRLARRGGVTQEPIWTSLWEKLRRKVYRKDAYRLRPGGVVDNRVLMQYSNIRKNLIKTCFLLHTTQDKKTFRFCYDKGVDMWDHRVYPFGHHKCV